MYRSNEMSDDDSMIMMTAVKHKGRSASVCYPPGPLTRPPLIDHHHHRNAVDAEKLSPPITPPATSGGNGDKHYGGRHHPATRTQSARLTNAKSVRRRFQFGDRATDGQNVKPGTSDPRLNEPSGSGTSSPVTVRRRGSQRRVNSMYHSPGQRKSAAYLDIPKQNSVASSPEPPDENSYRLRSFSYTSKGIVNRGDSFRKKHHRSNSIVLSGQQDQKCNDPTASAEVGTSQADDKNVAVGGGIASRPEPEVTSYNVYVLGAKGVGKTSLISQFMTSEAINAYDRQRDAPSQQTVSIMLNGIESELCFHELKNSKSLYQKKSEADAFLVMYSVVDKTTFQRAEAEINRLHDTEWSPNRSIILVGNKIDLARSRTVSVQDGKCLACTFRIKFTEISVVINHNVDELLVGILTQIRLKKDHSDHDPSTNTWYKGRGITRATMKARQMITWIFGKEDTKFKNCENLNTL